MSRVVPALPQFNQRVCSACHGFRPFKTPASFEVNLTVHPDDPHENDADC